MLSQLIKRLVQVILAKHVISVNQALSTGYLS